MSLPCQCCKERPAAGARVITFYREGEKDSGQVAVTGLLVCIPCQELPIWFEQLVPKLTGALATTVGKVVLLRTPAPSAEERAEAQRVADLLGLGLNIYDRVSTALIAVDDPRYLEVAGEAAQYEKMLQQHRGERAQ